MRRAQIRSAILLLSAVAVLGACDSGSTTLPPPAGTADTLPVLGAGAVTTRFTSEIAVRGNWAYTGTWGNRVGTPGNALFIWNVAGNTPVLTDSIILQTFTIGDVQISDDGALLMVATEMFPGGRLYLYDRSNPAQPQLISTFESAQTTPGIHTAKFGRVANRHLAFLSINPGSGGARLIIVDITDPAAPTEVLSRVMGNPFVHDVFVRDGLLFTALWHNGMTIWDIGGGTSGGTPENPIQIGNVAVGTGSIHNVWWFHNPEGNSKRYVFLGQEGPGSVGSAASSGDIHVIDITNRTQPQQVAVYSVPNAGTHNFWMDEASGILYAAYYNGGVRAIDVRGDLGSCTAAQKNELGFCDLRKMGREAGVSLFPGFYVWGVVFQSPHVYASDMLWGIQKIDASSLIR